MQTRHIYKPLTQETVGTTVLCNTSHAYMHTCIHAYMHTYRHTDIQTYRHTDIQTYRHTDIQTYIHTYIHAPGPATPLPPMGWVPPSPLVVWWGCGTVPLPPLWCGGGVVVSLSPPVVWWGCGTVPMFLFRPNTYRGTCMSTEHIYMRPQGSRGI